MLEPSLYALADAGLITPCNSGFRFAHDRICEAAQALLTKDQVAALLACAESNGGSVDWVNCGMCVDERGVTEFVPGTLTTDQAPVERRVEQVLRMDVRNLQSRRAGDRFA